MEKGINGVIGEYYAICELMRNGYNPLKATNPGQCGWDIILYDSNIRIQVKTVDWKKDSKSIQISSLEFDFMVIVLINYLDTKYRALVVPRNKIKEKSNGENQKLMDINKNILYSKKNSKRKDNKTTISLSTLIKNDEVFQEYEDKWILLS